MQSKNIPHGRCALPPCPAKARTYNAPMLDIKLIRERPDFVRERLAARGAGDEAHIDELLKLDEQRRKLLGEVLQHIFNHQTHHRGQASTLFSQMGIDIGATDLLLLLPNVA